MVIKEDILEYALKSTGSELNSIDMSELDDVMIALTNYNIFINAQLGRLNAQAEFLENNLNKQMAEKVSRMGNGGFAERKILAISTVDKFNESDNNIKMVRSKINMLQPISNSLRIKIDCVKRIYDRRARQ